MVFDVETPLIHPTWLVPDMVMHACFHWLLGWAPLATSNIARRSTPRNTWNANEFEVPAIPPKTLELPAPFPKSQTLFQFREIDGEIQNQEQIDTASGNLKDGSVKN